ncbi:MAG: hybrid sensor histidine kinase/response regulator, partial [Halobacteriovoraceae bacterium]|nr:hybrid sensor histidine kinase/response regulator [Halobacteriovoraceae bacterium]
ICLINKIEIEQVLVNLIKNSIDALMDSITEAPKINLSILKNIEKNCIELLVSDNGPGVPAEIKDKIFTPFFTTKKVGKGTGLGMAITKKLVEKHQGHIFLEDSESGGTTFTLQLPLIEMSSYTQNDQFLSSLSNQEKFKILVVDDEPQILNVLDTFLKDDGHIFIGSTGGEEALSILKKIDIDLIFTDYQMPNMNGTEFATKIREFDKDIPILYVSSADTLPVFQRDQKDLAISGLIIKPFSKEDILSALGQLLGVSEND